MNNSISLAWNKYWAHLQDQICTYLEFLIEKGTWSSPWLTFQYFKAIRVLLILRIQIKPVDLYWDYRLLKCVYLLSRPNIIDYFDSARRAHFQLMPFVSESSTDQTEINLFLLQCLTRPGFKIKAQGMKKLLQFRELWPLLINKGVEYRPFSKSLSDRQLQFEFLLEMIGVFREFLDNSTGTDFAESLKHFVAAPPMGFSNSTRAVYEAYRELEQLTSLRLGGDVPSFQITDVDSAKRQRYRIGFAFVSLMSGAEPKMVLDSLEHVPAHYHVLFMSLNEEEYSSELRALLAEKGVEIASINKQEVAGVIKDIRALDLDILFFCSPFWGHFLSRMSLVCAARCAPIQISFMGDIITTGLKSCDYFILPADAEIHKISDGFTEKILIIPQLPTSQYLLKTGNNLGSIETHERYIVYFNHAHMWKLNGDLIDAWAQILSRAEDSVIRLAPLPTPYHKTYLPVLMKLIKEKCKIWKIKSDRFEIIQGNGVQFMQRQMALADIYLDSFPYTGAVSIFETLSAGIPIVSLTGDSYPESLSRIILAQLDLSQNITVTNVPAYVDRAVSLGRNGSLRQQESLRIKEAVLQAKTKSINLQVFKQFWDIIDGLLVQEK